MATASYDTWQLMFPLHGNCQLFHLFSIFFKFSTNANIILFHFKIPSFDVLHFFCRVKKTSTRGSNHVSKDPLERLHSKLSTGGNSDAQEAPVDDTAAAPLTA